MKETYLSIRDLVVCGEEAVLNHFHLHMAKGEALELLGTEGSGLAQAEAFFSGKSIIQSGYVWIGSKRYYPGETLEGAQIQYIGEVPSLAGGLTVAENILLFSRKRKLKGLFHKKEIFERAQFLLSEFGIPLHAEEKAGYLSEAEKRFVELLRAAEQEIPLLVIGDIFGAVGQPDLQIIESCIRLLKERGTTILILGSGFPLFFDLDDRVEVLRGGRCVRTFFRETYDRENFVRWVLGVSSPMLVREEIIRQAEYRKTEETLAPIIRKEEMTYSFKKEKNRLVIFGLSVGSLQDFSLSAKAGEILGLYDMRNHANRELLYCLTGRQKPTGGAIYLDGELFFPVSLRDGIQKGIDLIPRSIAGCSVVDNLSYTENLLLSTMQKNSFFGVFLNRRMNVFLAKEFGRELNTEEAQSLNGRDLTAEDRMRVVLQRILLHRPRLLLVEDTVNDMNLPLLRLQTDYFSRLTKDGCTILISSPNLAVLRQICNRVMVIR